MNRQNNQIVFRIEHSCRLPSENDGPRSQFIWLAMPQLRDLGRGVLSCIFCLLPVGCSEEVPPGSRAHFSETRRRSEPAAEESTETVTQLRRLPDLAGIHNVMLVGNSVMTGSQPQTDADLIALKEQGVQIIVSVDGTPPDVAAARKLGLRYVHVPLGYGTIEREQQLALYRVIAEHPDSLIYFHCQHGKHRGPAAAAVACRMNGLLSQQSALELLTSAGTGEEYQGLWRAVRDAQPRQTGETVPELVESVAVTEMVTLMQEIDRQFAASKSAIQRSTVAWDEYRESNAVLSQLFKEAARLPTADVTISDELASTADAVLLLNRPEAWEPDTAAMMLESVKQRCDRCHSRTHDSDDTAESLPK